MHRENLKKGCLQGLNEFIGTDIPVRIDRRPLDPHLFNGFLIGMSRQLLLVQEINDPMVALDGYTVFRLADIRSYQVDKSFFPRALRLLDRKPTVPANIDLADWTALFISLKANYPLVHIELENKEPGCCFIGPIIEQTKQHVKLSKIGADGRYTDEEAFPLRDITLVEFDKAYVNALWKLVEHEANDEE